MSQKIAKYPGCKIKFGINITDACFPVISKVNVELFNAARETAAANGRHTDERTDRRHGSQYIIDDFPSKELQHRKKPFGTWSLYNGC